MDFSKKSKSNTVNVSSRFTNNYDNRNSKFIFENDNYETRVFYKDIIIENITNIKNFKNFYRFCFDLYRDDPNWVPPFWFEIKEFFKNNNPFWSHSKAGLFIAKRKDRIVGRIAAIVDYKYCETIGKNIGFFGFFECINEFDCAKALFQIAQDWLSSQNMEVMQGPINGRIDNGCGFLIKGYNSPPRLLSSYSPPHYPSFATKFNMKKVRDQYVYYIDLTKPIPEKLEKKARNCRESGVTLRIFNRFHTKIEVDRWADLFLETFRDHWGYVPVSTKEVKSRFGIKQLRWFVDSKLFLIAEFNENPIAYIWSTPDYNQVFHKMKGKLNPYQILKFFCYKNKINIGKMSIIGIKDEFRKMGIASLLNYQTLSEMKKRDYIGTEIGWVDEKNKAVQKTIELMNGRLYKKFRVYEKKLKNI